MAIGMPRDDRVMAPGAAAWALFPLRVTARYVRGGEIETRYNHTHKSLALFFFSPLYSPPFFGGERENWWPHTSRSAEWGRCLVHLFFLSKANPTNNNEKKKKKKWIKIEKNNMKRIFIIRCILHRCTCCTAIYTCTHVEKYISYYKYFFNLIGSQLKLMGQLGTGGGAREPGGNAQTNNVQ